MFKAKPKYILLLIFLLFPAGMVFAAWTEPAQAPTGGNVAVPLYSQGTGQTLDGTLHVGTPGSYATGLQGTGSTSGIQGNSIANGVFGNVTTSATIGSGVYGLAVDASDYALYASGGLGLGLASGDIWFLQQDQGLAWPRESDGALSYGVYVSPTGELQVRGHGAGINFMNQNATSLAVISEAGVLTVGGSQVCLESGLGCPSSTVPTLQQVTTSGNTASNQILLTPNSVEALRVITDPGFSPLVLRNNADNADLFRVNQNGDGSFAGNLTVSGQSVCRADGTNCPAAPGGASLWGTISGTNDIGSTNSGAVRIKKNLWFSSAVGAENYLDFDPTGNSISHFLIKSGSDSLNAFDKQHVRINLTGETLIGSDVFIGNNNAQGVAVMTPYNNPTVNATWAIRGKGTPTIEAVPGGGTGSVGNINLKSGELKLQWLNSDAGDVKVNDWLDAQWGVWNSTANNGGGLYVPDDLRVTGGGGFGGYNPDATYRVSTPSLYAYSGLFEQAIVGWDVTGGWKGAGALNAKQLCIQGDCKSAWPADAGGATGWTRVNPHIYLTTGTDRVGIGTQTPTSKLQINAVTGEEGVRIISSNFSPFVIRNSGNSADLLRVDQDGDINIAGINNTIGGATLQVPLAIKTDSQGNAVRIECGVSGCNNRLSLDVTSNNYARIQVIDGSSGVKDLVLQPSPSGGFDGGKVGIGTTAPNKLLHLKTTAAGSNAEVDIQTGSLNYWGIYHDASTEALRFWNADGVGEANVLVLENTGEVGIGTAAPSARLNVVAPNDTFAVIIDGNVGVSKTITSSQTISATNGFCIGSICKDTNWGPPNGAYNGQVPNQFTNDADTQYVPLQATDGQNYWCPLGWVMIGIRNTNPAQLICGRMW